MAAQSDSVLFLFEKRLGKTDINKRLCFPTKCLGFLPTLNNNNIAAEMEVWDMKSQTVRRFVCRIRRNGHPRPVITRGWSGFVRENKLKVGDRVIFFKEKDDDDHHHHHQARFMIGVERARIGESGRGSGNVVEGDSEAKEVSINKVDTTLKLSI